MFLGLKVGLIFRFSKAISVSNYKKRNKQKSSLICCYLSMLCVSVSSGPGRYMCYLLRVYMVIR